MYNYPRLIPQCPYLCLGNRRTERLIIIIIIIIVVVVVVIVIIKEQRKNVHPERILIDVRKKCNSRKNVYRPGTNNLHITINNIKKVH
jgi:uncharacterized membrane protein YqiK